MKTKNEIKLEDLSISDYAKLLRANNEKELLKSIDNLIISSLGNLAAVQDVSIFLKQKDLLIFQCKFAQAYLLGDSAKMKLYTEKAEALQKELESKKPKNEGKTPYKVFLSWVLSVEKYLGFSIDRQNDMLYFVEATKQMLNSYNNEKANSDKVEGKK
jgi:hypothetical protein